MCHVLCGQLALLISVSCLVRCVDNGTGDEPDAGLEAGTADASPVDAGLEASVPDAQVRPDARTFDFCGDAVFKLPFDGQNGYLSGQELEGAQVYYSFRRLGELGQIYRFDLELCEEQQLTLGGSAMYFGVMNGILVYDRYSPNDPLCRDLDVMDATELTIEPLLDSPDCESRPRTNGRHVTYLRQPDSSSPGSFRLYDRLQGTDVELTPFTGLKSPNMSDRYVVWTAVAPTPLSEGSDVLVHDLATGETTQLEASYDKWQDWVFVWEDYVTWSGAEGDLVPPYHLVLYDLVTGDTELLLEGDYTVSIAPIRAGLVAYNTSRYTGLAARAPSDIELHDIETQVTRRITAESGNLRAARIDPPYLLMTLDLGQALKDDLYVANLEALGVLDASGFLIPGGGVIYPPQP